MRDLRVLFETIRHIYKLSGADCHAHVATAFSDVFTNVHKFINEANAYFSHLTQNNSVHAHSIHKCSQNFN